jgi:hypothetical protein
MTQTSVANPYVFIFEVEVRKLLQGVASSGSEKPVWASKLGEDMANKEVFYLVGNRAAFTKDDSR